MTRQLQFDHTQPTATVPRVRGGRSSPSVLAAIAVGGALGAAARHGLSQLVPPASGQFPWMTLVVNVSGSLALGAVLVLILERFPPSRFLRPFVATGFLGAYTTYSAFAVETVMLVRDGHPATAVVYVLVSLLAGVAAAWTGVALARTVPRSPGGRP